MLEWQTRLIARSDPKTAKPYKKTYHRLEQVADYLCTIELVLVKYEAKENGSFKRNWLKQARSKRI